MPQGAYWYHSHLHTLTAPQVYMGLAGLLAIGRTDGNIPLVTENNIPIRNMLLQYNYVFDRADGLSTLNNYSWPHVGEHDQGAARRRARQGHLPSAADAGELPRHETGHADVHHLVCRACCRSATSAAASSSSRATSSASPPLRTAAARRSRPIPSLPDYKRDVQFTVNGQFQPVVKSKAGQTEIWVLCQYQRHRLHAGAAHRDGNRQPSEDRHRRPGRAALSGSALSRYSRTARGSSFRRRPATPSPSPCRRRATSSSKCRSAAAAPRPSRRPASSTPMTARRTRRPCSAM